MLIFSRTHFTPSPKAEPEASQTSPKKSPHVVTLEQTKTSQLIQFSGQSLVYVAHAILIVATLGILNWLYSTSPTSLNSQVQLSEQLIDSQLPQD